MESKFAEVNALHSYIRDEFHTVTKCMSIVFIFWFTQCWHTGCGRAKGEVSTKNLETFITMGKSHRSIPFTLRIVIRACVSRLNCQTMRDKLNWKPRQCCLRVKVQHYQCDIFPHPSLGPFKDLSNEINSVQFDDWSYVALSTLLNCMNCRLSLGYYVGVHYVKFQSAVMACITNSEKMI